MTEHREHCVVELRHGHAGWAYIFAGNPVAHHRDGEGGAGHFAPATVAARVRVDGLAQRERSPSGDELPQEFAGTAPSRRASSCRHSRAATRSRRRAKRWSCPPIAEVHCTLAQLGEVEIIRVTSNTLSGVWRAMLDAHHYLKSGPLCGAQQPLRLARGISYSACALRVDCRDRWIGWTEAARQRNHPQVGGNNSRFLIAPSVRVKGGVVGARARPVRLAQDWEQVYGYAPLLLETYVERGRFAGT